MRPQIINFIVSLFSTINQKENRSAAHEQLRLQVAVTADYLRSRYREREHVNSKKFHNNNLIKALLLIRMPQNA